MAGIGDHFAPEYTSMSKEFLENVVFDELTVGQQASLNKLLTQKDIKLFAAVSGDIRAMIEFCV